MIDNVKECISIAAKIDLGTLDIGQGAEAILNLVHRNRAEAAQSMADAVSRVLEPKD